MFNETVVQFFHKLFLWFFLRELFWDTLLQHGRTLRICSVKEASYCWWKIVAIHVDVDVDEVSRIGHMHAHTNTQSDKG